MPIILRDLFGPVWAVQRPSENPILAAWMERWRTSRLAGTLDKDGSALKLARLVRDGEIIGLLLDQNAGRQGVMLGFLGRPSWHHKVPGVMARRFGAAVVPTYQRRERGHLRFTLVFEPPIEPDPVLGDAEAIETDVVRRLSSSLAARVRQDPGQWLWLHDRWRRAERVLEQRRREEAGAAPAPGGPGQQAASHGVAEGTNGT
jgi:KDO2-lipid IV(A) lauroyltransferase